ncbi:MAG: hypothetical protein ACOZF2_11640 [Thermodesulfobacteriota bacterium]
MKTIISVLVESPFYFTMPLRDRYRLVRRLNDRDEDLDLNGYQEKVDNYLRVNAFRS